MKMVYFESGADVVRQGKLTTTQINEIRNSKKKIVELAQELKVSPRIVSYYKDPEAKEKARQYHNEWYSKLSKKQKKALRERYKEYMNNYLKKYQKERYHSDPEFRKMRLEASKKYKAKRRKNDTKNT